MTAQQLAQNIAIALQDKGGEDIKVIDLKGVSPITDYCVIATGTSGPNLKALATQAANTVREHGSQIHRTNGDPESGWLIIDCFDIIIHVFTSEARTYYAIEKLWDKAREISAEEENVAPLQVREDSRARADLIINLQISGIPLTDADRDLIVNGTPVEQWPQELIKKAKPFLRTGK